jgi:cobalt-zinc-cadmium efflux system protein
VTHAHRAPLPEPRALGRRFALGVALNLAFVLVEAACGLLVGSLALVADAGHNLSDVASLLLAWGAAWLAGRSPTATRTYGFRRATILASLASAVLLLVAVGVIAWEAVGRLRAPQPVDGGVMIAVAAVGVVVNTATALLFVRGRRHDLNQRGAFLHMAADAAISLGVVVSGLAILRTGWLWLDPAVSLAVAVVILAGTWSLLRESLHLAVDGVPGHVDLRAVHAWLASRPGVTGVHDLHVWALSTTEAALTAHLVMPGEPPGDRFLAEIATGLFHHFGIGHATVQVERDVSAACPGCEYE